MTRPTTLTEARSLAAAAWPVWVIVGIFFLL